MATKIYYIYLLFMDELSSTTAPIVFAIFYPVSFIFLVIYIRYIFSLFFTFKRSTMFFFTIITFNFIMSIYHYGFFFTFKKILYRFSTFLSKLENDYWLFRLRFNPAHDFFEFTSAKMEKKIKNKKAKERTKNKNKNNKYQEEYKKKVVIHNFTVENSGPDKNLDKEAEARELFKIGEKFEWFKEYQKNKYQWKNSPGYNYTGFETYSDNYDKNNENTSSNDKNKTTGNGNETSNNKNNEYKSSNDKNKTTGNDDKTSNNKNNDNTNKSKDNNNNKSQNNNNNKKNDDNKNKKNDDNKNKKNDDNSKGNKKSKPKKVTKLNWKKIIRPVKSETINKPKPADSNEKKRKVFKGYDIQRNNDDATDFIIEHYNKIVSFFKKIRDKLKPIKNKIKEDLKKDSLRRWNNLLKIMRLIRPYRPNWVIYQKLESLDTFSDIIKHILKQPINSVVRMIWNFFNCLFIGVDIIFIIIFYFNNLFKNIIWKPLNIRVPYCKKISRKNTKKKKLLLKKKLTLKKKKNKIKNKIKKKIKKKKIIIKCSCFELISKKFSMKIFLLLKMGVFFIPHLYYLS